jgi:hypothetical protein
MTRVNSFTKVMIVGTVSVSFLLGINGCGSSGGDSKPNSSVYNFGGTPRMRKGDYPTATFGTTFLGPNLGSHGYGYSFSEGDGITYTCRGGHIDITHVRIAADWTAYLTMKTFKTLTTDGESFSYGLGADRSKWFAHFAYSENWKNLPKQEKEKIASDVSVELAQYMIFTTTSWHEILTWFGFKCIGVFPEFPSAFSWEDSYSNLLGTIVAANAMKDTSHTYNEAMTIALNKEMEKLGIQSADVARKASQSVKGKWYTGETEYLVDMKRRNFDIGLKDGYVTPTLVPNVPECVGAEPVSYPVPNPDVASKYGIKFTLEVEPHEWESGKILSIVPDKVKNKRIVPAETLPAIMDYVEKDAVKKGYICDFNGR